MHRTVFTRALALLFIVAVAVSCDAITGGGGSFTLTLSDTTLQLGQGKRDTVVITLGRSSYNKPIALTVDGVPAGVSATLLAPTVPGNSSVTGMEVYVAPTATPATTKLTIHASGAGVSERTASFDVAVGVTGSFSMSSDGFPLTAAQGGGGVGTILVTRSGGHADNVTLATTPLPSGVTASFATSPTTGASTPVTFAAAAGAVPGNYNVTITGTAAGISPQSVPVTINVIAPPATASLSMTFCPSRQPIWFAYKNQGYPWQNITPSSGAFTFQATSTLAVAYEPPGATSQFEIDYASRAEFAGPGTPDCAGTGTKTVSGSIGGATVGQTALVAMGPVSAAVAQASPNFTLAGIASRALDLVATKGNMNLSGSQPTKQVAPDKFFVSRGLNPANGANLGTIDFAAQGIVPATSNLTVANLSAGDSLNIGTTFVTGTNSHVIVSLYQTVNALSVVNSMPVANMIAGDFHELLVETFKSDFSNGRLKYTYLGAITDHTETLGPGVSTATLSVVSTSPYTRLHGQVPVQPEYPSITQFVYYQDPGTTAERDVYVVVTAGYLGGAPASTWDVIIPEFGSVPGLSTAWLPSTSLLYYEWDVYGGSVPVIFGATPTVGDTWSQAWKITANGALLRAGAIRRQHQAGPPRQYLRR